ncbi:MAG: DUF1570 domain-containing protein [Pirellulales bacterium]|nr:DUF1570 domain-containing protein [Pirellulales bacterium]
MVRLWLSLALVLTLGSHSAMGQSSRVIVRLKSQSKDVEATPLWEASDGVLMLGRDGRVFRISRNQAKAGQLTTTRFTPVSRSALRAQLEREFGSSYEVTATSHYLVVHPRGNGTQWSQRFEELYRSFGHYFKIRGFDLVEPEFPLVAIVLPSKGEFERYAKVHGDKLPSGVLGYYSPMSNRVALFDASNGKSGKGWQESATTIIHEATHQTAFNTGIHKRLFASPHWIVEGLGTLFEAEGVWNARHNVRATDRVNRDRLAQFKKYLSRRKDDAFVQLLASDDLFRTDPDGAYAESWGWTYYLMETRPRKFAAYLKRLGARGQFSQYSAADRLRDFAAEFGADFKYLDAQFLRHMNGVR